MTATLTPQVFRLPDLGEGLTEAEVLDWRVSVGDVVTIDQIVVEVETAKAAVDVPIPVAGTVVELYAAPGAVVAVGAPLIAVATDQPATADAGTPSTTVTEPPPAAVAGPGERYREEERAGSGSVLIGYGTSGAPAASRRRARRTAARAAAQAAPVVPIAAAPPVVPRVISPVVRRLARSHGIDIAALTPSGPGGVVLRRDVEAAIAAPRPTVDEPTVGPEIRIPLRGVRRAVADKLVRSRTEIPDATTWVDVDATALLQLRDELSSAGGVPIGLLALMARICVAGLQRFPQLNAYVDTEREEIVQLPYVNLGFAAQTDRGLVVPVVRDAHRLTLAELAVRLREHTEAARAGGLAPRHLTGGTFTLNNYGVFGVDGSTPIINHPEAALLGVGRVVDRPWVVDGQLAVRSVTQLSLSFDHRVCDGGVAGGFLRFVADCVERPQRLILHL